MQNIFLLLLLAMALCATLTLAAPRSIHQIIDDDSEEGYNGKIRSGGFDGNSRSKGFDGNSRSNDFNGKVSNGGSDEDQRLIRNANGGWDEVSDAINREFNSQKDEFAKLRQMENNYRNTQIIETDDDDD